MAFTVTPYPEWSWSVSRDNVFNECLLKYYYQYYASHNGWLDKAPFEAAMAYRFKQIVNLYTIFGDAIHQVAEATVNQWKLEKSLSDKNSMLLLVNRYLKQAVRDSRQKNVWRENPKKSKMLHEIYYGDELPIQRVELIRERIIKCVENLYTSTSFADLMSNDENQILEVEQLDSFNILDDKIYVKLDLLYKTSDETFIIGDWKSGVEDEKNENQMLLYAMYIKGKYNVPFNKIKMVIEYLADGKRQEFEATEETVVHFKQHVINSIEAMRMFVEDDNINKPVDISKFVPDPSKKVCSGCNFREICPSKV